MAINYELINKGGISLGTNFELLSEKPLDSRLVVPSLDGLQNYIDSAAAYEGMIAYVSSEKKHYEVKVIDGVLSYRPFGLTEAELNDLITNATTAAMEFKGATATLPENPAKGDMYKVAGENINIKIDDVDAKLGDSIVYDGEKWFLIPSGDDIEDTWRPVDGVNNDATLKFVDGDKTVAAVAADGTIKYNHATVAAPTDVTAEGDEKTRTYITAVETDGYGHITGYKTATENVEDTNTTYEFEGQAEESNVYFQVTSNEEGASAEVIYLDAYSKNEANTELAKKVDKVEGKSLIDDSEIARLATLANYDDTQVKADIAKKADAETVTTELAKKVDKVDGKDLIATSEIERLATLNNYDDTQVKADIAKKADSEAMTTELGKKVDKIEGYSLVSNTEIARLADVDNYDDTAIKADIAKKADAETMTTELGKKVDKVEGYSLVADTEIARLADVDNYNDAEVRGLIGDNAQAIEDLEGYVGTFTHATAKTVVEYINAKTDGIATSGNLEALAGRVTAVEGDVSTIKGDYLKAADIADFETKENVKKVADDLAAYVESNDAALAAETKARTDADAGFETRIAALEGNFGDGEGTVEAQIEAAVAAEKQRAEGIEGGLRTDVNAVAGRMDTAEGKITALETESAKHAIKTEVEGALALKADKSVVDAMYTNTQIDTAVQGAKDYAKGLVDAIPAQTDYTVTCADADFEATTDAPAFKRHTLTQNGNTICTIDIPKELVVEAGSVKEVTEADKPYAGAEVGDKYIELVIANQEEPIYVPAKDLVDIYTAKDMTGIEGAEIQIAISNTNEISATLVNGGITEEKLASGVKTKLNKTWEEVGVAKGLVDALADGQVKTNKEAIENIIKADGLIATAKSEAISAAASDAQGKVDALANGQVKTNKEAIEAINNESTGILKQAKDYADGLADNYADADHDHIAADITDFATEVAKVKVAEAIKADEATKATQDGNGKVIADTYAEKATTYTKEEVDALLSAAQSWGEF
jgi:hypothetical protein